jgi:hypothetical protein
MSRARRSVWPAACGLAVTLGCATSAVAAPAEPVELALLRAVHLGASEQLSRDRIAALAVPTGGSNLRFTLARAALLVRGEEPPSEWPVERLLDDALAQLHQGSDLLLPPARPGYGRDDLVYTLTYALVVGGRQRHAEALLIRHLQGGSELKRSIALQALHNIGSVAGQRAIQRATEGPEIGFLAGTLLIPDQYPPLQELATHWRDLPFDQRTRDDLFAHLAGGCSSEAILAAFLAGFLPPAADRGREQRELAALVAAATELPLEGCFKGRMFALRSYGMRTRGAPTLWKALATRQETAWQRALAARIGFAHFPQAFVPAALDRLAVEPDQYVQWELLWGTVFAGIQLPWRDVWDLWNGPPHFQLDLSTSGEYPSFQPAAEEALLAWLERGHLPGDPRVRDWLLTSLARSARGSNAFRLLSRFAALPAAERHEWVLADLAEPAALPALRYFRDHAGDTADRESLAGGIAILESGGANLYSGRAQPSCCQPTRTCLETQVWRQAYPQVGMAAAAQVTDEAGLRRFLERGTAAAPLEVRFLDDLERVAEVRLASRREPLRFAHLYGCWQWTDAPR